MVSKFSKRVRVIRKRSGSSESHIIHIPRDIYDIMGRPREVEIEVVITTSGLEYRLKPIKD